jgi:hypothetical protein
MGQGPPGVRRPAPAGRDGMGHFRRGLEGDELAAARAQAVVPAVPAPERLITAQAGGGAGVGPTWSRWLVHRAGPPAGVDVVRSNLININTNRVHRTRHGRQQNRGAWGRQFQGLREDQDHERHPRLTRFAQQETGSGDLSMVWGSRALSYMDPPTVSNSGRTET